ncbi:alpha/beta fold hydrolase [Ruminococcus flavefaciens]|uniref:alpha/beta fold hydrolase n=1 Tax=Ruminococcus flavefaciens TaxID=1265 RepID=UPI0004B3CF3A|nr:alpha/beta hydrolase [Ruminococcus flavefaciens]
MKKALKITGRILLILLILLLLFTLITFIIHRIKTNKETEMLKEAGYYNPVSVGDYSLNVYDFGNKNGRHTFVGMSGRGTFDYSIRMNRLMGGFTDENRIVVVDRPGYGLSDDTKEPLTVESVVNDYRAALKNAGIKAPYILLPHSMGGAYATYWVSKYPEEIEGVVFLDGTLLDGKCDLTEGSAIENRAAVAANKIGLVRLAKSFVLKSVTPGMNYTDEQRKYSEALNLHNTFNHAFAYEEEHSNEICDTAFNEIKTNDVPKVYICAHGFQTKEEVDEWQAWEQQECEFVGKEYKKAPDIFYDMEWLKNYRDTELQPYLDKLGNCELVLLPGIHCIYDQRPDDVAEIIVDFLDRIEK